uniref:Putative secreted protein n=1 Tax=Ixodes ricinus TaxID=34613 RepID=A0A6B0V851_IXORI
MDGCGSGERASASALGGVLLLLLRLVAEPGEEVVEHLVPQVGVVQVRRVPAVRDLHRRAPGKQVEQRRARAPVVLAKHDHRGNLDAAQVGYGVGQVHLERGVHLVAADPLAGARHPQQHVPAHGRHGHEARQLLGAAREERQAQAPAQARAHNHRVVEVQRRQQPRHKLHRVLNLARRGVAKAWHVYGHGPVAQAGEHAQGTQGLPSLRLERLAVQQEHAHVGALLLGPHFPVEHLEAINGDLSGGGRHAGSIQDDVGGHLQLLVVERPPRALNVGQGRVYGAPPSGRSAFFWRSHFL